MIDYNILLQGGGYEAMINSSLGATCFKLLHKPTSVDVYRTPESVTQRNKNVLLFGNPLFFPCNAVRGGEFEFGGVKYVFTGDKEEIGSGVNGCLFNANFLVSSISTRAAEFIFRAKKGEYMNFPHAFTVRRKYALGDDGMTESIRFTNDSTTDMPFMLGFRTTYNLPFAADGDPQNVTLFVPAEFEQKIGADMLPTLEYVFGGRCQQLRDGTYVPHKNSASCFCKVTGDSVRLIDNDGKIAIVSKSSREFGYRMIFKHENDRFVAIEPHTAAADCFHLETAPEQNGLIVIKPGQTVTFKTVTYVEKL